MRFLFIFLTLQISLWSCPQYYCTGASKNFYQPLLNLIGSIHKHNYENLVEIAVYDFGLEEWQRHEVQKISKVRLCTIQENNPHLLTFFPIEGGHLAGHRVLGWYAWKPVVIRESLEKFPYVLWLDSACVVLKPLDDLFAHIQTQGYFLIHSGSSYPLQWSTTNVVKGLFSLEDPRNAWVLNQECVMGGFVGVTKNTQHLFLNDWYEFTKDINNFADNGTAGGGWGACRHDQTLLSIMAHMRGYSIHPPQFPPGLIKGENGREIPFYASWNHQHLEQTDILVQNGDFQYSENVKQIKYKN